MVKEGKKCLSRESDPDHLHARSSFRLPLLLDKIMNLRYARKLMSINPL